MQRLQRAGGFTLIELSIVLVIIGLIVGGVLVGQDLIRAAEVRSVLSDIEKFNTAVNTFHGKYNCLPGDCANATNFWPQDASCGSAWTALSSPTTSTCNGNGNGIIEMDGDNDSALVGHDEVNLFWQQLSLTNLLPGSFSGSFPPGGGWSPSEPGYNVPASRISNGCYSMIYTEGTEVNLSTILNGDVIFDNPPLIANVYWFGAMLFTNPTYSYCGGGLISPVEARSIDSKTDDGVPSSGNIQVPIYTPEGGWNNTCINAGNTPPNVYQTTISGPQCQLVFKVQF
jgi:prepilin-type N-terminal cleavage/methylation domain-containing protein